MCVGFGIYGVLNIKLDYDAIWFMDQKSYQTQYFKRFEEAFPDQGERVEVYIGEFKIRVLSRLFVQAGHETMYASSGNNQFFH